MGPRGLTFISGCVSARKRPGRFLLPNDPGRETDQEARSFQALRVYLGEGGKGKDQSPETAVVVLEKETARAEMIEQAARKIETEIKTEETLLEEMMETGKVALEVQISISQSICLFICQHYL